MSATSSFTLNPPHHAAGVSSQNPTATPHPLSQKRQLCPRVQRCRRGPLCTETLQAESQVGGVVLWVSHTCWSEDKANTGQRTTAVTQRTAHLLWSPLPTANFSLFQDSLNSVAQAGSEVTLEPRLA